MKQPVTGSFELIRDLNTACILNAVRQGQPISRADIARQTGLTPATVSNITGELIELGLIAESERGRSSGGRKPMMLKICSDVCLCGGVHISSDGIEVAVTNIEAEILWKERMSLKKGVRQEEAVDMVARMLRNARESSLGGSPLNGRKICGIGVCMHGLVSSEEGIGVYSPNLGWENVRIGEALAEQFGLPVHVENDVRAMSLAESWCGAAQNVANYVYLYIGAGIGGSVIIDHELYRGEGGFAGEFGHTTIEPDGPLCTCGNRGCLQAIASEYAMAEQYRKRLGSAESVEFSALVADALAGRPEAVEEIQKGAFYIGIEVGNIVKSFSPSLIILGGAVTATGPLLLSAIEREVQKRGLRHSQNRTRIVFSRLGASAPIKGAVTCVIRRLFERPRLFI